MSTIPTTRQVVETFTLADVMTGRGAMPTPFQTYMNGKGTNDPMTALAALLEETTRTDASLATEARTHLMLATAYMIRNNHAIADLNVAISNLAHPFHRGDEMLRLAMEALDHRVLITREYLAPKTAVYQTTTTVWSSDPDSFSYREVPLEQPYWSTSSLYCTLPARTLPELWFLAGLLTDRSPEAHQAIAQLKPYVITGWTNLRERRHPKDRDAKKLGALLVNEQGVQVGAYPLPERDPYYVEPVKQIAPAPKPASKLAGVIGDRANKTHDLPGIGRLIVAVNSTHARLIHYPLAQRVKVTMQVHPHSIFTGMTHIGGVSLEKARQVTLPAGHQGFVDVALQIPKRDEKEQLHLNYEIGTDADEKLANGALLMAQSDVITAIDHDAQIAVSDEDEPHNKNW